MSEKAGIPHHVAIIMDGNGRWAALRGKPRSYGHTQGVEPVRSVVRAALRNGIGYVTLYAFSTENWSRPQEEVDALMELFCTCVTDETDELRRQGVAVRLIGDRSRFSARVQEAIQQAEAAAPENPKLTLILALNYSSRSELTAAVRQIAREVRKGALDPDAITENTVGRALYTAPYPDPDLVIRTSGEQRLSNFLLWQSSYAELYFPEVLWPDFGEADFEAALAEYARRDRRFGAVKQQDNN